MISYSEKLTSFKIGVVNWIKRHKNHLIIWSAFMFYEGLLTGLLSPRFGKLSNYAIHYAINISFFYFHAHFTLMYAAKNRNKSYWRMPVYVILELALYVLVIYAVDNLIYHWTDIFVKPEVKFGKIYFTGTVFRGSFFAGFATGYYFLITFLKEKRRADKLERVRLNNMLKTEQFENELIIAQNAYLRAQVNPHFLFNTLDFIYHSTRKTAPVAAEMIAVLADIMRYASDNNFKGEFSNLGEEIDQVSNLIQLHQIKNDYNLTIDVLFSEEIREVKFIPLVLSTLVENMLKHGNLEEEESPATINLSVKDKMLSITTRNLIHQHKNTGGLSSGINNVIQRLKYAYGDQCEFSTHIDENNYFNTSISLKLA